MKHFVIISFKALFVFFLCTVCFLLLTWLKPALILNNTVLSYSAKFLEKKGVVLKWKEGNLTAASSEWNKKNVQLSLADACVSVQSLKLKGCFTRIAFAFNFGIKNFKPSLISIGPIDIHSQWVRFTQEEDPNKKEDKKDSSSLFSSFELPSILSELHPNQVNISLENVQLDLKETPWKGSLLLTANEEAQTFTYLLHVQTTPLLKKKNTHLEAKVELTSLSPSKGAHWTSKASFSFQEGKKQIDSSFHATGSPLNLEGKWDLKSSYLTAPFDKISVNECPFSWKKGETDIFKLSCPVTASILFPTEIDVPYRKLLQKIQAKVLIDLEKKKGDSPVSAKISIGADPLFSTLQSGKGALNIELSGMLSTFPKGWNYSFNSQIELNNFNKVVHFFSNTSWAVPQPFNTLQGTVLATIKGKGDIESLQTEFPFQVETNLRSENQKLVSTIENNLKITQMNGTSKLTLDTKALLKEVVLMLPPLTTALPPRILPDERITTSKKSLPTNAEENFLFNLSIATGDTPLFLISKISPLKVPVQLKLASQNGTPLQGTLNLLPFDTQLFKRKAEVKFLKIMMHEKPEENEIRSEILILYTDYTISIMVNGLLSHPEVQLTSTPPLSEKQLIAVLLFGKSIDQLDSDQVASVGDAGAAITDGMIGLASLYALASTPIESVGYDRTTRVFSAKIKLQDGTSLNIGSDLVAVRKLGVRKRLGANWFINTYLENPFLATERSATGFLEWNFRY